MVYRLTFHTAVERDVADAYNWYEDQLADLGRLFLRQLQQAFDRLELNPDHYSKIDNDLRRLILKRFPYVVIYEIEPERVHVIAVLHTSRDPSELKRRMQP